MARLGKSANVKVQLNKKDLFPPVGWFDTTIKASFGDNTQANITTDQFEFVLDAYAEIKEHISKGLVSGVGIFEGISLDIRAESTLGSIEAFKGFLDLQNDLITDDTRRVIKARIKQMDGLNSLNDRLAALDYGYLTELGEITPSDYVDVPYVVIKIDNALESLIMSVMIYAMAKQTADSIKGIAVDASVFASQLANYPTGGAAALIYAGLALAFNIAYTAALIIALVNLGIDLVNALVQPKRVHKATTYKFLMEKAANYLGYGFNTSIEDLDNVVYLPSNNNVDAYNDKAFIKKVATIEVGTPHATDRGYTCLEVYEDAKTTFYGQFAILNGVVEFHTVDSDYWVKQSTFVMRDILEPAYGYNTKDNKSNRIVSFSTDVIADEYTLDNFTGTNYQVITDAKTVNNAKFKTIEGLDQVNIPYALGNRKDSLNGLEKVLLALAKTIDTLSKLVGGKGNLSKKITSKIGVLKVSSNNHTVPKLLWMENGAIPKDHREKFSAKTLYNKYHIEKSFLNDNYKRQRKLFNSVPIAFGFADFVKLILNSYFTNNKGKIGKVLSIDWNMAADKAVLSYWIREPYTTNLKETFIEP